MKILINFVQLMVVGVLINFVQFAVVGDARMAITILWMHGVQHFGVGEGC